MIVTTSPRATSRSTPRKTTVPYHKDFCSARMRKSVALGPMTSAAHELIIPECNCIAALEPRDFRSTRHSSSRNRAARRNT